MSQKKSRLTLFKTAALTLVVTSLGCATIPSTKPFAESSSSAEIMKQLESQRTSAYELQADVIAPDPMQKAVSFFDEAKEEFGESDIDKNEFLEDANASKAYFEKATKLAKQRKVKVDPIFKARQSALDAGVRGFEPLSPQLKDADDDFREASSDFGKELSAAEYAGLQQKYLDLEIKAVQGTELGKAKAILKKAVDEDAESKAPKTLKMVKKSFQSSENLVATNPRNPRGYNTQVTKTLTDTLLLSDVMDTIKDRGGDLNETVALEIVRKDRKLSKNKDRIASLRGHVNVAHSGLSTLGHSLSQKEGKLQEANRELRFQQAMEQAGKEFDKNEAAVFQQGNDLIIRLKKIDFAVGRYAIPEDSKGLLSKVNGIIANLSPKGLTVQGHTDATGSKALNDKLSEKRARSVAEFLQSQNTEMSIEIQGMGSKKPLSPNTSRKGRAMNRRVDIVVKGQI